MPDKQFLSASEVQKEYGYSRHTLLKWEDEGDITPTRIGNGQRRYDRGQLEALLKQTPTNGSTLRQAQDASPPPIAVTSRERPTYLEYGTSGLNRFSGSIFEEKLRELRGRAGRIKYREMRLNNPVIAAVFFGLVNALKQPSIRAKPASDKPADTRAALWLETCLNDMSFSWMDTLDLILQPMFEQGFTLLELVYKRRLGPAPAPYIKNPARSKYDDGATGWRKWAPRPAESLADGSEWIYDAHGGLQGINQQPDTLGGLVQPLVPYRAFSDFEGQEALSQVYSVPIEKLLHFRTTLHPANNPEGMSLLRPMYLAYHYATNLQEIEGIGAERDLAGVPVMYLGEGTTLSGVNSDYEEAKTITTNLRWDEQTGVVIPHPKLGTSSDGRGVLLELLSTGGRRNWDVGSIVERYEKRMAMSCLAQFIMLGMSQVGSYALSRHQGDLFVLAATAFLQSVAEVINRHGVPRLFSFNAFPGITGYPELVFSPVGIPDLEAVSEFVNKLVERQVLTPDPELERHLRQLGGLPAPAVEVATSQPESDNVQTRSAEDTALLLRRLSLAIEPLQELMVIGGDEAAQMLRPLVEDLREALGTGNITNQPSFEQNQARAANQMTNRVNGGTPIQQAASEYVALMKSWACSEPGRRVKKKILKAEQNDRLTLQGRQALNITEGAEAEIEREWETLTRNIETGMAVGAALALFRERAEVIITRAMTDAWLLIGPPDRDQIEAAVAAQMEYLDGFIETLQAELITADKDEVGGILLGNLARALMYAGAIWALYNFAKVFGRPGSELWRWDGPVDHRTCPGCYEQMKLGPRPLSQIKVMPGQADCLSNCRHELVKVK